MNNPQPPPWYRQPWPWFLIMLPFSVVVASFVTLYIALTHDESLVRDDYYKEGLAINRRFEQEAVARSQGISAELRYDSQTMGIELRVTPTLDDRQLTLTIVHPTDSDRDQSLLLQASADGVFLGKAQATLDGKRYVLLQHDDGPQRSWRVRGTLLPGPQTPTTVRLDAE